MGEAKRKEDEKEYLRSEKEKSLDRQNELKKRWSEYDEDDEFLIKAQKEGKAKKDEKLPLKSLGQKEESLELEMEEEKKKEEEKENLLPKKKGGDDRQNELKKRWSEYNEDDDFCKKSKKEDNENRRQDERDEKKKEKEEKQM